MKYQYQLVDRIPGQMAEGIVYHTEEFELAGLLCACGCGHRITLLVPDSHQVWQERGYATVQPSIGVFDAPCKSHYIISAGDVKWFPTFTDAGAAKIMRAQIDRHIAYDIKAASWPQLIRAAVFRILRKLRLLLFG